MNHDVIQDRLLVALKLRLNLNCDQDRDLYDSFEDLLTVYNAVFESKKRLTRELDVAMRGEDGAAVQASLCDLIHPAEHMRKTLVEYKEALNVALKALKANDKWHQDYDDYGGYPDSELCEMNYSAIKTIVMALI